MYCFRLLTAFRSYLFNYCFDPFLFSFNFFNFSFMIIFYYLKKTPHFASQEEHCTYFLRLNTAESN